jgi:hypothetical protein
VELARVGHLDAGRIGRVRLELADVVQAAPGHRDVAVDAGNVEAIAATAWATVRQCSSRPWA